MGALGSKTSPHQHPAGPEPPRDPPLPAGSQLPSGPRLPSVASAAQPAAHASVTRRRQLLTAETWIALAAASAAHGVDRRGLPVAVFVEVLRRWSGDSRFTLWYRRGDETEPLGSAVEVPAPDGTVVARLRKLAERLASGAGSAPTAMPAQMPVVVTDRRAVADASTPAPAEARAQEPAANQCPVWELVISDEAGGVRLEWLSRDEVLPPGLTEHAFEAFVRALTVLARDPDRWSAATVVELPQAQQARIARVNATATAVPDGLLHTPVRAHAARRPDDPAVITADLRLSFGELDARINRVAHRLREAGATAGQLVAVVMEKGWEQVVGMYAALAAGAAYLPVDPQVPPERLGQLLEQGRVSTVLTQSWLEPRLRWPSRVRRLLVDRASHDGPTAPPQSAPQPTDLAYVIPTSGSTGIPKGVMVDHRGALNALTYINQRFRVGPADRCFAVSAIQFDISVYDHFGVLGAGGALVVPQHTARPDPAGWIRLIRSAEVTIWNSVPAFLDMVVSQTERPGPGQGQSDDSGLGTLRLVILGGDFIPLDLPARLRAMNPRVRLVNGGGPAESCVYSIMYEIGNVDAGWTTIPYGRPVANQRYHVLDEAGQPCPTWVAGELHISSEVGLARGYWDDPDLTRQRFRDRPELGGRSYATGDIGRYLPSGDIELLGRKDFQVKLQGVRVELGEIEAAIAARPEVAAVAVVSVRPGEREVVALRAYVVWADGPVDQPQRLTALREALAQSLPPYLLPSRITALAQLPLTPNGKVDRLALAGRRRGGQP